MDNLQWAFWYKHRVFPSASRCRERVLSILCFQTACSVIRPYAQRETMPEIEDGCCISSSERKGGSKVNGDASGDEDEKEKKG